MTTRKIIVGSLCAFFLSAAWVGGCAKKDADKNSSDPDKVPVAAETVAAPALTASLLTASESLVKPFTSWDEGLATLQEKLGSPTQVLGASYTWALLQGDACTYLTVQNDGLTPPVEIRSISKVQTVSNELPEHWKECVEATKSHAPAVAADPNAPMPPKEGTTSVTNLRAGIAGAASQWVGRSVTVAGILTGITVAPTAESELKAITLVVATSAESKESIGCTLVSGATAPTLASGTEVLVSGRVSAEGGGGLDDCGLLGK